MTSTAETDETANKVQLILPYSGKPGIKLMTKEKKHIRKTLKYTNDSGISKQKVVYKVSCKR